MKKRELFDVQYGQCSYHTPTMASLKIGLVNLGLSGLYFKLGEVVDHVTYQGGGSYFQLQAI
jgi:hypothetical protein